MSVCKKIRSRPKPYHVTSSPYSRKALGSTKGCPHWTEDRGHCSKGRRKSSTLEDDQKAQSTTLNFGVTISDQIQVWLREKRYKSVSTANLLSALDVLKHKTLAEVEKHVATDQIVLKVGLAYCKQLEARGDSNREQLRKDVIKYINRSYKYWTMVDYARPALTVESLVAMIKDEHPRYAKSLGLLTDIVRTRIHRSRLLHLCSEAQKLIAMTAYYVHVKRGPILSKQGQLSYGNPGFCEFVDLEAWVDKFNLDLLPG